jgi:hypothetical protein
VSDLEEERRTFAEVRAEAAAAQEELQSMLLQTPMWQSEERHRKLKIMMQDRSDRIQSELAGLAFDSLQQVFIAIAMALKPLLMDDNRYVLLVIDPAAGGPQSDYVIVSIVRGRCSVTVSVRERLRPTDPKPRTTCPGTWSRT